MSLTVNPTLPTWTGSTVQPSVPPLRASSAPMGRAPRFLYVTVPGVVVRRAGSRLRITKEKQILQELPAAKLQGVLCYGNIEVTSHALRCLLEEGVWVSLFSRHGNYRGRLQPPAERGGRLRLLQWERSRDAAFCLRFAVSAVQAKLLGQKQVIAGYSKNYVAETLGESHGQMLRGIEQAPAAASLDELRGIEGSASRAYWSVFRRLNRSDLPFENREKRGTHNAVNALLNLGYTMLTRELDGLLEAAGLEPVIGFYHQPDGDRPSLACDWVEEFRHVVIDRLVLSLINQRVIQAKDFEDRGEQPGTRLSAEGLRKFIRVYETALEGKPGPDGQPVNAWRPVFLRQLGVMIDAIREGGEYNSHMSDGTTDARKSRIDDYVLGFHMLGTNGEKARRSQQVTDAKLND